MIGNSTEDMPGTTESKLSIDGVHIKVASTGILGNESKLLAQVKAGNSSYRFGEMSTRRESCSNKQYSELC